MIIAKSTKLNKMMSLFFRTAEYLLFTGIRALTLWLHFFNNNSFFKNMLIYFETIKGVFSRFNKDLFLEVFHLICFHN